MTDEMKQKQDAYIRALNNGDWEHNVDKQAVEEYVASLVKDMERLQYNYDNNCCKWRKFPENKPNKGGMKYVMQLIDGKVYYRVSIWHKNTDSWDRNSNPDSIIAWATIPRNYKDILNEYKG